MATFDLKRWLAISLASVSAGVLLLYGMDVFPADGFNARTPGRVALAAVPGLALTCSAAFSLSGKFIPTRFFLCVPVACLGVFFSLGLMRVLIYYSPVFIQ